MCRRWRQAVCVLCDDNCHVFYITVDFYWIIQYNKHSMDDRQRRFREKHPNYMQEWARQRRHPCESCGSPCYYRSKLCKACYLGRLKQRGEEAPAWKGGRWQDAKGYVHIAHPDSAGGRIQEHRFVMMQKLGRELEPDEIVHHLNGIKSDNRPENLVVLKRRKHKTNTLRLMYQARIQDLEAEVARLKAR